MTEPANLLHYAELRVERAVLNVQELLEAGDPISQQQFDGALTRIVIAANTVAAALQSAPSDNKLSIELANILWRFGEELGISVDESRP